MKKLKFLFSTVLVLLMFFGLNINVFALENNSDINPRGIYRRSCVAYEPNSTSKVYTYKEIGTVSGDNRKGSSTLTINYKYSTSGSASASISGYANTSVEANYVLAKMKATVGVEVTTNRSWTKGTSSGATYSIPAGKFETLTAYIPAVKTAGQLKYKVYMDGYPGDYFYEYQTLKTSYAPQKSSVHFVVKSVSN